MGRRSLYLVVSTVNFKLPNIHLHAESGYEKGPSNTMCLSYMWETFFWANNAHEKFNNSITPMMCSFFSRGLGPRQDILWSGEGRVLCRSLWISPSYILNEDESLTKHYQMIMGDIVFRIDSQRHDRHLLKKDAPDNKLQRKISTQWSCSEFFRGWVASLTWWIVLNGWKFRLPDNPTAPQMQVRSLTRNPIIFVFSASGQLTTLADKLKQRKMDNHSVLSTQESSAAQISLQICLRSQEGFWRNFFVYSPDAVHRTDKWGDSSVSLLCCRNSNFCVRVVASLITTFMDKVVTCLYSSFK